MPYSMSGMSFGTNQAECAHQVGSSSPAQADNLQNGVAIGRLALDLHAQDMSLRPIRTGRAGRACKAHFHQVTLPTSLA